MLKNIISVATRISASVVFLMILASSGAQAASCYCGGTLSVEQQIEKASLVFEGTALRTVGGFLFSDSSTRFYVQKVLKGEVSDEIIDVRHFQADRGDCGINFRRRDKYLVLTFEALGKTRTNACMMQTSVGTNTAQLHHLHSVLGR